MMAANRPFRYLTVRRVECLESVATRLIEVNQRIPKISRHPWLYHAPIADDETRKSVVIGFTPATRRHP